MGMPGPWELILILLIVVLIFGAKRIPEIMGGIGKGIKTFKKTMEGDDEPSAGVRLTYGYCTTLRTDSAVGIPVAFRSA